MARRRFADLEARLLSYLQSPGAADINSIQDESLRKYAQWKFNQGGDKRKLPASSTRNRQGLKYAIIEPFGSEPTTNALYLISVSGRARNWLNSQSTALKTAVGWRPVPTGTNQPSLVRGFEAARAIIRQQAANSTEQTSRITGKKYNTKATSSQQGYSIPFGSVSDNAEITQARAIQAAVPDDNFSVSFLPEKFVKLPELVTLT
jgi:hypothetical protein